MPIRKTALAGLTALALSGSGCSSSIYEFDGKIGDEQVKFRYSPWNNDNTLEVKRPNGVTIKYFDELSSDLRVDKVEIIRGEETVSYGEDSIGVAVIQEAQLQFDGYLAKILEIKRARGLADIKKE